MKALGIVRNVDELGRVVIPKEVRRAKGWEAGQPMEMFVDEENLVLRAYGEDYKKKEVIDTLKNMLRETEGHSGMQIQIHSVIDYLEK